MSKLLVHPHEYFRECIDEAARINSVQLKQDTEYYLVNMLTMFINSEYLFSLDKDGKYSQEPLALMYAEAHQEETASHRAKLYQKIGDVSLYVSGFFSESFNKKIIDIDYYMDMGRYCYSLAKEIIDNPNLVPIYDELIFKFDKIVDLLSEIASKSGVHDNKSLLRIYDLWMKTKSERLARLLREKGVLPIPVGKLSEN